MVAPCVVVLSATAMIDTGDGWVQPSIVQAALLCIVAWLFTRELRQQRRDFQLEVESQRKDYQSQIDNRDKEAKAWRHAMLGIVNNETIMKKVDEQIKREQAAEKGT